VWSARQIRPKYIRPYAVIKRLNLIAYQLDLLVELKHVYNMLHVSQLRKYILDPDHAILIEPIEVTRALVYEQRPVQILDPKIK